MFGTPFNGVPKKPGNKCSKDILWCQATVISRRRQKIKRTFEMSFSCDKYITDEKSFWTCHIRKKFFMVKRYNTSNKQQKTVYLIVTRNIINFDNTGIGVFDK